MPETVWFHTKIGNEDMCVPQRCFKDGKEVVFKTITGAKNFMRIVKQKSNIEMLVKGL